MQRILILVFLLAVAGGIYWLVSSESDGPGDDLTSDATDPGTTDPDGTGLKGSSQGPGPDALPELRKVIRPTNVLMLANRQASWPMLVLSTIRQFKDVEYRSWFLDDMNTRQGVAGDGRGMAELKAAPDDQYLIAHDVEVLFLDALDPNAMPESFWKVVAERVNSGRMGLYFRPTMPIAADGTALSEHPALSHPVLKELLPIARAALIQGTPQPGVFGEPQPLRVTPVGIKHPATRLVDNDIASGKAWARTAEGDGAFSTKFCYPVLETKPGMQTLVELEAATPIPAIVATPDGAGKPRVLWMGNVNFSQRAYHIFTKDQIQKLLVNHWLFWLAGQHASE